MTEAKIRESVRPVQQKSNRTEQSYIMVEWRQTSGFQATLLVLVPSGGGGGELGTAKWEFGKHYCQVYRARLLFRKVWEVWSLDTVCNREWILISGLIEWG